MTIRRPHLNERFGTTPRRLGTNRATDGAALKIPSLRRPCDLVIAFRKPPAGAQGELPRFRHFAAPPASIAGHAKGAGGRVLRMDRFMSREGLFVSGAPA
jgi:hypothetical protein